MPVPAVLRNGVAEADVKKVAERATVHVNQGLGEPLAGRPVEKGGEGPRAGGRLPWLPSHPCSRALPPFLARAQPWPTAWPRGASHC